MIDPMRDETAPATAPFTRAAASAAALRAHDGGRTPHASGAATVVLAGAAGGTGAGCAVGQRGRISAYGNLTGRSPLGGRLPPEVPLRFTDLSEASSGRLRALARGLDPSLA